MKNTIPLIFWLSGLLLTATSCVKELRDINDIETLQYEPSFSIPIGPLSYTLEEIMPPDSLLEHAIPDTIPIPDTSLLIYDDILYFYNPEEGFDVTYHEPLNLRSISEQSGNVESLMLKTNITNNLPVEIELQGYLLDDQGTVVSTISKEGIVHIDGPPLDNRGAIVEPVHHTVYTHFYEDEIDRLITVRTMEIYLFLQTFNEGVDTLRVYSSNGIDLQFALRANLIIPITP